MAVIADTDLWELVESGKLGIEPRPDRATQLQPASIDLRLGGRFLFWRPGGRAYLSLSDDPAEVMETRDFRDGESVILHPGKFALAATVETVTIPASHVAVVNGRSSIGRRGVQVHATAGWIDPGYRGTITLELSNVGEMPVELQPGMRICQLILLELSRPAGRPYAGKYQGALDPTPSRLQWDGPPRPPAQSETPLCLGCRGRVCWEPAAGRWYCRTCDVPYLAERVCRICNSVRRADGTCRCRGNNISPRPRL